MNDTPWYNRPITALIVGGVTATLGLITLIVVATKR